MDSVVITLETGTTKTATDVTGYAVEFVAGRGDGLLQVFCPHATAGIAIIETGAGSDADLLGLIDHLLPPQFPYQHRHGSSGHGADHVLPAFVSPSVTIPVIAGALQLGTWQSIVFVDPNIDNPRRSLRMSFLSG